MEVCGVRMAWFSTVRRRPAPVTAVGHGPRHRVQAAADTGQGRRPSRFIGLVAWTVVVIMGEIAAWLLVRSQGNLISGDSPHYLIAALSLSHLTMDVIPAYAKDMVTHAIYDWAPGTTVRTPYAIHAFLPGPHGPVFAQGIGLPALLAPFMAVGSVPAALFGYFTAQAAGVAVLHQRAARLADLGRSGRVVLALALAAPALWLATTQVYPDLISGIFLGCGFVELALLEKTGRLGRAGTVVAIVGFGAVAWFQIKNAAPVLIGVAGFALIGGRRRSTRTPTIVVVVVVLGSLAALAAYNQFYFGHLLGLPQPGPAIDSGSGWRIAALLIDRDQGLVVQVPTVLLGAIGLWFARKRTGMSAVAVVLAIAAVLVVNGTYPNPPLGGTSFAGRFEWTVAPILLAWSAVFLHRLQAFPRRLFLVGAAVAGLWVVQLVPILAGDHVYSNQWNLPFRPWDPSLYPGWWPLFDRVLPTFAYPSGHTGGMFARLLFVLALLAATVWLLVRLCRPAPLRLGPAVAIGSVVALLIAAMVILGPPDDLPAHPQTWTGADLGSPWSPGDVANRYPPIRLLDVGAGRYRGVFTYRLSGSSGPPPTVSLVATPSRRDVVSKWLVWRHPTDASLTVVQLAPLDLGQALDSTAVLAGGPRPASADFDLSLRGPSTLSFEVRMPAHADLVGGTLSLAKTSGRPAGW